MLLYCKLQKNLPVFFLEKANDAQLALSLWIHLQGDDIQPTDEFLQMLAEILIKNNIPVPFTVPDKKESILYLIAHFCILNSLHFLILKILFKVSAVSRKFSKLRMSSSTLVLRRLIDSDNVDRALLRKNELVILFVLKYFKFE